MPFSFDHTLNKVVAMLFITQYTLVVKNSNSFM